MASCPCCEDPERCRAIVVAPMIEVTDRHFRMLIRIISAGACPQLWSEMTWDRAILYNSPTEPEYAATCNQSRPGIGAILGFSVEERPLVLQLGGAEPELLARSARLAEAAGYDEINLNCGCPAQTKGRSRNCFGARLMKEPQRVADCCAAIGAAVRIPVSVKIRLGVDEHDSYADLQQFVTLVAAAGVRHFVVHARKAILNLDTAKNRSVPPLRHEWVFALIADFPHLRFQLNGGVASLAQAAALLRAGAHGVMIGRRANADPYMFALTRDALAYAYGGEGASGGAALCGRCGSGPTKSRRMVLAEYGEYAVRAQAANWEGTTPEQAARTLLSPLTGLFYNTPAAKVWKHAISALMQDRPRLLAEPVREILQSCVRELLASPGSLGPLAPALLDGTPRFQSGPLPTEAVPPRLPCLVKPEDRARGPDDGKPRVRPVVPRGTGGGATPQNDTLCGTAQADSPNGAHIRTASFSAGREAAPAEGCPGIRLKDSCGTECGAPPRDLCLSERGSEAWENEADLGFPMAAAACVAVALAAAAVLVAARARG